MKSVIVLLLQLFSPLILLGQIPVFYNVTTDNNLPSNDIYSIVQDKNGFIWLGTDAGLYKYNGVRYEYFQAENQNSRAVTGLTLSNDGRIYFYNFTNQLFYVEDNIVKEIFHPYKKLAKVYCDESSNIWICHNEGASKWDKISGKWSLIQNGLSRYTLEDLENNMYVIHYEGITKYQKNSNKAIATIGYENINFGQLSVILHKNTLWLFEGVTSNIINIVNDSPISITNKAINKALVNRKLTNAKLLSDGFIWICTYSGLIRFDPVSESVKIFYENVAFTDCIIDRENNYWFTTLNNGFYIVPNSTIAVYHKQNGLLPNENVKAIYINDSILYFSTSDGHIGKLNTNIDSGLTLYSTLIKGDINALFYDNQSDRLYFNINQNLIFFKNNQLEKTPVFSHPVKCYSKFFKSYLIGSSFGLQIEDDIENQKDNFLLNEWTNNLCVDTIHEKVFTGTNNGLFILNYDKGKFSISKHYLKGKQIRALAFDYTSNTAYLVTVEGRIYRYNNNKLVLLHKLDNATLVNHLTLYQNKLVIASNQGIKIWDLETKEWFYIDKFKGLSTNDIKQTVISENYLWAASSKGLHRLPLQFDMSKAKAIIYLRKLTNGKEALNVKNLNLKHNSPLNIFTEVSHYSSLGKHQLSYRINGGTWLHTNGETENIAIPNLPKGKVNIEIKAIDIFGNDSKNRVSVNAYVHPPYWQKGWFIAIVFLFLSFTIYLFLRWRIQFISNRQKKEFDKINLQNQLNLSQEIAMKAQMKPHFVFNILNSIKSYIYENDREKALKYLKLFSDLVRNVLEMSSKPKVTLEEEIKTLKYYIALEEMLLEGDFEFELNIEKEIILSEIRIPSLILQPFVENAFKHGLRHKKGAKKILISIKLIKQDTIEIEIIDNGIGRDAAQKINMESATMHRSFATETSQKRIDLLNLKKTGVIGLEYKDIVDKQKNPAGTKVILRINIYE